MNFGMIFLCLLIGAVVGFEVGKYVATKKIQEFLGKIAEDMKQTAEKQKAEAEQKKKEAVAALEKIFSMAKKPKDTATNLPCAEGDTDGDINIELGRQKFLESLGKMKDGLNRMEEDKQ